MRPMIYDLRCRARLLLAALVPSVLLFASPVLAQWANIGTGIDYRSLTITMGDGKPNNLFLTRMAVANTNCIINSMIASNRVAGARERPSAMAARYQDAINNWGQAWGQRNNVIVAVNGSFEVTASATIAGGDICDGWYAHRFDDFSGEMGLVWKYDRSYFMGVCPHYQASGQTVTIGGNTQTFAGINIPRANNLIIYTPQYNNNTLTSGSGVEVLVALTTPLLTPSSTVTGTIEQVRVNQGATPIPFDHIVLSGAGSAATFLQTYAQVGQPAQISQNISMYTGPNSSNLCYTADSHNIVKAYGLAQGNYYFLMNGVVQPTSNSGMIIRNPRTFVAYNSTYIFFVVCDGRSTQSVGMTSDEMGAFCLTYLLATDGVNMDGGGSSVMVVNGAIKNTPSDGVERAVVNGLMMVNVLPEVLSTAFSPGQTVGTTGPASLRLGPGTDYYAFASIPSGTRGTVVSNTVSGMYAKGSYWWKCNFGGTNGWVAENSLGGAAFITQQPSNQTVVAGGTATFTVAASGASPLSYEWQKNRVNLSDGGHYSGCTNATLTVAGADPSDVASYSCVVANVVGSAVSSNAVLSIITLGSWGDNTWGQSGGQPWMTNLIAIAAGGSHNLALRPDGTVLAWGNDDGGQTNVPGTLTNASAIAAGGYHSLAIRPNGTVLAWGNNNYGQTNVPASLTNVIGISAGTWHSLALRADGSVASWGGNTFGQCNVPAGLSNVVAVAAGAIIVWP